MVRSTAARTGYYSKNPSTNAVHLSSIDRVFEIHCGTFRVSYVSFSVIFPGFFVCHTDESHAPAQPTVDSFECTCAGVTYM